MISTSLTKLVIVFQVFAMFSQFFALGYSKLNLPKKIVIANILVFLFNFTLFIFNLIRA